MVRPPSQPTKRWRLVEFLSGADDGPPLSRPHLAAANRLMARLSPPIARYRAPSSFPLVLARKPHGRSSRGRPRSRRLPAQGETRRPRGALHPRSRRQPRATPGGDIMSAPSQHPARLCQERVAPPWCAPEEDFGATRHLHRSTRTPPSDRRQQPRHRIFARGRELRDRTSMKIVSRPRGLCHCAQDPPRRPVRIIPAGPRQAGRVCADPETKSSSGGGTFTIATQPPRCATPAQP